MANDATREWLLRYASEMRESAETWRRVEVEGATPERRAHAKALVEAHDEAAAVYERHADNAKVLEKSDPLPPAPSAAAAVREARMIVARHVQNEALSHALIALEMRYLKEHKPQAWKYRHSCPGRRAVLVSNVAKPCPDCGFTPLPEPQSAKCEEGA